VTTRISAAALGSVSEQRAAFDALRKIIHRGVRDSMALKVAGVNGIEQRPQVMRRWRRNALSKKRIKNPANRGRVKEDGGYITFVRQA
jgi:hypothetical protein